MSGNSSDPFRPHSFVACYGFEIEGLGGQAAATSVEGSWRRFTHTGLNIREATGCTTGGDQVQNRRPGICDWGELILEGAITKDRTAMLQWYTDMTSNDTAQVVLKDITVHLKDRANNTVRSVNFLRCQLVNYTLCHLDGDERDRIAEEKITIRIGHSEQSYLA